MSKADDARFEELRKRKGDRPVLLKHMWDYVDHVVEAIVAKVFLPLRQRLDALEKAAAELKSAQSKTLADAFRGAWMAGTDFKRGDLVVADGSLWLSMVDTREKPGAGSDWKMITKRGRDGKDLR